MDFDDIGVGIAPGLSLYVLFLRERPADSGEAE